MKRETLAYMLLILAIISIGALFYLALRNGLTFEGWRFGK